MKWNKYSIQTTTEAVDFISSMLGELGIEGIEIEDNVQLTQEEAKTMFVDFIPDLPPDDGSAKVNFYIDSDEDDNTIMDKVKDGLEELRLFCNVGAGTISESQTEDKDCDLTKVVPKSKMKDNALIDENGETVDISKLKVQVSIQPDDIEMSDEAEAGLVSGEIINLIYKGDHYSYVVRTEYGYDLIVDDEYLWNMNDKVSLVMPEDKMKFQLKK